MEQLKQVLLSLAQAKETYVEVYIGILRYAVPVLALILLWRCFKPLLRFKREPEIWAWLYLNDGTKYAITHWESVIGRHRSSDVCIDFPTVSRNHAVLTRYDDGSWTITDADSKSGVLVNNRPVSICALEPEDVITIGGIDMTVRRNAFGRQVASFEGTVEMTGVDGGPVEAVFIRAPWVESTGPGVQVLGRISRGDTAGRIVAVRQGRLLATSFHPELTGDTRVHRLFVDMVKG